MKDAQADDLIARNPCEHIRKPSSPHREMQVWDSGQAARFIDQVSGTGGEAVGPDHAGLRRREVLGLRRGDTDFTPRAGCTSAKPHPAGSPSGGRTPEDRHGDDAPAARPDTGRGAAAHLRGARPDAAVRPHVARRRRGDRDQPGGPYRPEASGTVR